MLDINELRNELPKIGDVLIKIPVTSAPLDKPKIQPKAYSCVVRYVHPKNLWYQVEFNIKGNNKTNFHCSIYGQPVKNVKFINVENLKKPKELDKIFSKDKTAYSYLSESASNFPFGEELNNILRKIGFIEVENKPQMFGAATIYVASKK